MKRIRYSKYVPEPASEMSMEDLLSALSDYFLQSGFNDNYWYELPQGEKTLEELKRALEQALLNGEMFDEEMRDRLQQMQMEGELEELIEKLIERMQQEDYISIDRPFEESQDPSRQSGVGGQVGDARQQAKFEITDKSLDFLGFKALRDLLGSLGKSSFGRHDTRDMATGIEAVRALLARASRAVDENAADADTLCNMAKVFASEEILKVAQHALELHGGNGVMLDFGVEKIFRDAAIFLHMDATVDISRFKIVKSMFPHTAGKYAGAEN